ncbi:MAG: rhodanese-like domain-containing protein [Anaerolineae bacterium]
MSSRQERVEEARARRRWMTLYWTGGAALLVVALVVALILSGRQAATTPTSASLQRMPPQEAYAAVQAGEAVLYDVRIADAYDDMHAEGAISLPESDAVARISELPADRLLVFY